MSFTPTPNYALQKPTVGTELDAWGDDINVNFDIIDTQLKLDADAAATANAGLAGKAPLVHVHSGADITSGTVGAARMPAYTGDVTAPVGTTINTIAAGVVTTAKIADGSVTNPKLASMPVNTIKGSVVGGAPIDLTPAQAGAIIGFAGAYAPITSPSFLGVPTTATTPAAHDSSLKLATTAFVVTEIAQEAINSQGGVYTLAVTDPGKQIKMTSATAVNLTVPPDTTVIAVESVINVGQYGAGIITIAPGAGVTIRSLGGKLRISGQYGGVSLKKIGVNEWWAWGDLMT